MHSPNCELIQMFRHIGLKSNLKTNEDLELQINLLEKKDTQIRRLQAELQQQKRRADNAVKMLESYKNIQQKFEDGSEGLRNQINKRIKVEQQLLRVQKINKFLENGIQEYIKKLKQNGQITSLQILNQKQEINFETIHDC